MVKAMDCGIVVREFILQSRYYIHFRANTLLCSLLNEQRLESYQPHYSCRRRK